jgi:hypothetical protein
MCCNKYTLKLKSFTLSHLDTLLHCFTILQETAELLARHLCCAPTAANTTAATATSTATISATYGDFASFITDPHYSELQARVHAQLAQQLVALGSTHFRLSAAFSAPTLSQRTFLAGLAALGLQLGARDAQRLLVRFALPPGSEPDSATGALLADRNVSAAVVTPGQRCDTQRFVAAAAASQQWRTALQHASAAAAAAREAESELRAQRSPLTAVPTAVSTAGNGLSIELVRMAQCLGMRVHTDADLLWIAEAALNAPLPDGWELRTTVTATAAANAAGGSATGSSSEPRRYNIC